MAPLPAARWCLAVRPHYRRLVICAGSDVMRLQLAAILFLIAPAVAVAQTPAPTQPLQHYDVPAGPAQTVAIITRDFAPGEHSGRHLHRGVEMGIVMRGDFEVLIDGQPPHLYHAGESFLIPREAPHDGRNPGATPTTLAITYVIDKGAPLRVALP